MWGDAIAWYENWRGSSSRFLKLLKSAAAEEIRQLRHVRSDDGRRDVSYKSVKQRRHMAWLGFSDEEGTTAGIGDAWLAWYPTLINHVVQECREKAHAPFAWEPATSAREIISRLPDDLKREAERCRKLSKRVALSRASHPKIRNRGPSKQALALSEWIASDRFNALCLKALVAPDLEVEAFGHDFPVSDGICSETLIRQALRSFQSAVPKAKNSLTVHTRRKVRSRRYETLAQNLIPANKPKEVKCKSIPKSKSAA